ncbi:hypothetical protein [Liquorilactobacillus hordei]|uniref:hypothetical protein n=1 Tax=Liquorilactobacillus hordei TaxID=468911 RepID=UPI001CBD2C88|nr:hypothetical protein [Liquorilactobacillus hordei]MBZ2406161.1 hypothetical protein [Liquorilactobacillus hordei]
MMVSVSRSKLREEILSNQNEKKYDPDSSPKSWEQYAASYKHSYSLYSEFGFENPEYATWENCNYVNKADIKVTYQRLYAFSRDGGKFNAKPHVFRLGGETDWNFKEAELQENKFGRLSKLIKKDDSKKNLVECKNMYHTLLNFSIMPATGNVQSVKSKGYGDYLDRFDSFVAIISDYYLKNNTKLLLSKSRRNGEALEKYFSNFKDVYDYFEQHYLIDNQKYVDRLVSSGKQKIETEKDVDRYTSLAKEYWKLKENSLNQL